MNELDWNDLTLQYPFFYQPMSPMLEDGWTAFQPQAEFSKLILHSDDWRLSHVNSNYQVCPSYPSIVVVPKSIDDETLKASSEFRQGGRFPVLSYRHPGGGVLIRSSQPLTGATSKRCREDEKLVNAVLGPGKRGYIVDTRTQVLAQSAKTRGGGFELETHYPQWRRVHKSIDRHLVTLDSLYKLMEACNDTTCGIDKWISRLEGSNWLSHVKDTLNCACLVAQCLDQDSTSVLVHGTEGLDATLQVTSLAQIILNPDCRTVRGFEALVEREWLQAGHPFSTRHQRSCYAAPSVRSRGNAATFLIFLDCVWQIAQQFLCSFEFGENFLLLLAQHCYSSQFGTFLGDNESDRHHFKLSLHTVSLWSHINRPQVLPTYLNPLYEPNSKAIWPSVAPISLTLWNGLYLRWVVDQSPHTEAWNKVSAMRDEDHELRRRVGRLRHQLAELEKEAVVRGIVPQPIEKNDIAS